MGHSIIGMYLDASPKKVFFIIIVTLLLFVSVFFTNVGKTMYFGSTPFFYTVTTSSSYLLNSLLAKIEKSTLYAHAFFSRSDAQSIERGIPVLTYHRIVKDERDTSNVPLATFRDQMQTLKSAGWNAISLEDFEAYIKGDKQLPDKSFLITFDDGAKESFYPADPVLQAYDYHAAIFVIVASSLTPESTYYLSPEELKWILRTGRWAIGSHSYDGHRPYPADAEGDHGVFFADRLWLPSLNRLETPEEFMARVNDDLTHAKNALEETYNKPIDTFAFPLGNETNIEGAANFPEGAADTETSARAIYKIGFLQLNNQGFTFNFPISTASSTDISSATQNMLATNFIVRRIHVDHDWNGARLLSIMENGRAKQLPYEDDFNVDHGWITAWGTSDIGRNNFTMQSAAAMTSAATFLDGSELWDNYSFDAAANWRDGSVFIQGDLINAKTFDACVFSPGQVEIQSTVNGVTQSLVTQKNPSIQFGENVTMGIRVHGSNIECAWNYASIAEAYSRNHSGGIGFQIWNETPGQAQLQVSSVIVRPLSSASSTPTQ